MRSKNLWNWGACGKHPVGRDYLIAGYNEPFLKAFSDWIQDGYQKLNRKKVPNTMYSWRFWAKGPKKGSLICGVARDSSDSIGRPYPLLIMGTGPLKGWEDHWDLLPQAFEKTWDRIEHLATGRFVDFGQMEDEVRSIPAPSPGWKDFESRRGRPEELESSLTGWSQWDRGEIDERIEGLRERPEIFMPLKLGQSDDPFDLVNLLHFVVRKSNAGAVPNSIFMGGVPGSIYLAVFMRPLAATDFVRLWSVCGEEDG